jgi:ABC-2 type transport system ATP-binding protein
MIEARGLRHGYGAARPVLDGVDLDVGAGLTLLVGPNGCGKSTLLRLLAGVERPDSGVVAIDGLDLWRDEVAARRRLAYVPERPELDPYVTLRETAAFVGRLFGRHGTDVAGVLERLGLEELGSRTVEELSLGQRRRAHLALAMLAEPSNLLLDEPLEALDTGGRQLVLDWLDERLAAGAAAVVVSHVLEPLIAHATAALSLNGAHAATVAARELDAAGWHRLAAGGRRTTG